MLNRPNLDKSAAPWGRAITTRAEDLSRVFRSTKGRLEATSASLSGSATLLANQVNVVEQALPSLTPLRDEMLYQNTSIVSGSDITHSIATPALNVSYALPASTPTPPSITFNSPDGQVRTCVVIVQMQGYNSRSDIAFAGLYPTLYVNTNEQVLVGKQIAAPNTTSAPTGWTDAQTLSATLSAASVSLKLTASGTVTRWTGSSATVVAGFNNIVYSIFWGAK